MKIFSDECTMSELVRDLSNVVYRRFTYVKKSVTGKYSYVYGPSGESVTNEEEVWSIL